MGVGVVVQPEGADGGTGLAAADGSLELQHPARLRFARNLAVHQGLDFRVAVVHPQLGGGVQVLQHHVVVDGNVAGGLEATCTKWPWETRRMKVPPIEITSSSGWGEKISTVLGNGAAGTGRVLSSAFGLPPGQPVMVCCRSLNTSMFTLSKGP